MKKGKEQVEKDTRGEKFKGKKKVWAPGVVTGVAAVRGNKEA